MHHFWLIEDKNLVRKFTNTYTYKYLFHTTYTFDDIEITNQNIPIKIYNYSKNNR